MPSPRPSERPSASPTTAPTQCPYTISAQLTAAHGFNHAPVAWAVLAGDEAAAEQTSYSVVASGIASASATDQGLHVDARNTQTQVDVCLQSGVYWWAVEAHSNAEDVTWTLCNVTMPLVGDSHRGSDGVSRWRLELDGGLCTLIDAT